MRLCNLLAFEVEVRKVNNSKRIEIRNLFKGLKNSFGKFGQEEKLCQLLILQSR